MFSTLLLLPFFLGSTLAQTVPANLYSSQVASKILTVANSRLPNPNQFPQYTNTGGTWQWFAPNTWTSGFFPDTLYQLNTRASLGPSDSSLSGKNWLTLGRKWSDALVPLVPTNTLHHDVGFVAYPFVSEYALNPSNSTARNAIVGFANDLAKRYSSVVGCTRSWDSAAPNFQVIIDNMMNLDVFFQSHAITPNQAQVNMAISHADKTLANHFRADGSTYHVVTYNQNTGAVISRNTAQGYADSSTWSRGQAWAIHGFANMHARTQYQRYLDTARKASAYFISHLPASGVPPWDFNAPNAGNMADSSAATIAANGFLSLSQIETNLGNSTGAAYYQNAAIKLLSDVTNLYWKPSWQSLLSNGTVNNRANPPNALTGTVYGDYFFVKAGNTLLQRGLAQCPSGTPPTSTSSTPSSTAVPTGVVIHPGASAAKCLAAASNANNAAVQIQDCNGSAAQVWTVTGGTLKVYGDKCLDVASGSTANGVKMQIYTCSSGSKNQQFTTTNNAITWANQGKCLDLTDGSLTNGNVIQTWTCTGGKNQIWNIVGAGSPPPPVSVTSTTSSTPTSTPVSTTGTPVTTTPIPGSARYFHPGASVSLCLTASSNANNAAVTVTTCNSSAGQQWILTGGTLQIYGSKCLDVTSGSTANGTKMQIYNCSAGNKNQQFTTTNNAITWTGQGKCLDLTDGSTANGNVIQTWTCTGGKNQVWNIV